MTPIGLSAGV